MKTFKTRHQFYLPDDLSERLEAFAAEPGSSKTAIMTDAFRAWIERRGATELDERFARRIFEIFNGPALATRLSDAPVRDFQTIAQILHVLKKVDRPRSNATVDAMNWEKIDGRIGALWSRPPHEVQVLLGTCHLRPRARAAMAPLIARRFAQMEVLSGLDRKPLRLPEHLHHREEGQVPN